MQSKPKSNSVITHRRNDNGSVTFVVKDAGEFTFDPAKASEANRSRATLHGWIQRISDAAAKGRDPATGKPTADAPQVKLAAMTRLRDHYESGSEEWSPARVESAGPGLDSVALAAVAEGIGRTVDEVRELVKVGAERKQATPRDYLKALTTAAKVKPIYDRMVAAGVTIDADAELDEATKG